MHYDNNLNDFSWYEVGDRKFYNKAQALFEHLQTRHPIRWNLNDDVYSQYDWTKEPAKSLDQLYAERAQGLRDRYDYLVLHFSGGSDSCNILETCIKNNIFIDEIITRGAYEHVPSKSGVITAYEHYAECLTQAWPLMQWVKNTHWPNVKLTVIETSKIINDYFAKNPNWIEQGGNGLSPGMAIRANHDLLTPDWQKITESGRKVAHIYGADKPKLFKHKNSYYTRWLDKSFSEFNTDRIGTSQLPQYIEFFYWGRNAVELQIKQLHTLKNYIKSHNVNFEQYSKDPNGREYEDFVASIIYNRTLPLYSVHLKDEGSTIIQAKDAWFAKDLQGDGYKNWKRGVDYFKTLVPEEYKDSNSNGIVGLWSKPYNLGE